MAHILVYLERTPRGLHPASALALCVARDIGTNRGASITALCAGDAQALDAGIARAAGRFGADVLVFTGPDGLRETVQRLHPVHLLAPWTPEGLGAVAGTSLGPAIPRWVQRARPPGTGADTVTGIIAGALPWHAFDVSLDPEYLGEVDQVGLADWVAPLAAQTSEGDAPGFSMLPEGTLYYVAGAALPRDVQDVLHRVDARPIDPQSLEEIGQGNLLWFLDGDGPLPQELARCPVTARTVVFVGDTAAFDASWMYADLVIPGSFSEAVRRVHEPLWRAALA